MIKGIEGSGCALPVGSIPAFTGRDRRSR